MLSLDFVVDVIFFLLLLAKAKIRFLALVRVVIQKQEQTKGLLGKNKKLNSEYYFFACGLFWAGEQELGDTWIKYL